MQDLRTAGLQDGGLLDQLTERALQALGGHEPIAPSTLTFLLRRYATTGRDDLEAVLGLALARALDAYRSATDTDGGTSSSFIDSADWLVLFAEATALSGDERLSDAARALATRLRRDWPAGADVASVMRSVDACLRASDLFSDSVEARDLVAAAVDELERVVGLGYRPGEGIACINQPTGTPPELSDQIGTASALLTAYGLTARLPYSMLAEELMQFAQRTWPLEPGTVEPGIWSPESFAARCEAVRVFCRIASLHADPDYREAAVIASESNYAADAERLLMLLAPSSREHEVRTAAIYGTALLDWLSI